jgi:hypothetical protein
MPNVVTLGVVSKLTRFDGINTFLEGFFSSGDVIFTQSFSQLIREPQLIAKDFSGDRFDQLAADFWSQASATVQSVAIHQNCQNKTLDVRHACIAPLTSKLLLLMATHYDERDG